MILIFIDVHLLNLMMEARMFLVYLLAIII